MPELHSDCVEITKQGFPDSHHEWNVFLFPPEGKVIISCWKCKLAYTLVPEAVGQFNELCAEVYAKHRQERIGNGRIS